MAVDADAETRRERVDRLLEPGVVERDEPSALLTHEVMVVMAIREHLLEPRLSIPQRDSLDETVLGEQIQHAVDARASRCPSIGSP